MSYLAINRLERLVQHRQIWPWVCCVDLWFYQQQQHMGDLALNDSGTNLVQPSYNPRAQRTIKQLIAEWGDVGGRSRRGMRLGRCRRDAACQAVDEWGWWRQWCWSVGMCRGLPHLLRTWELMHRLPTSLWLLHFESKTLWISSVPIYRETVGALSLTKRRSISGDSHCKVTEVRQHNFTICVLY